MIIGIARADGLVKVRNLYFPFANDKRAFEAAPTQQKMKGLPPDVIDMIADLEPFQGGNDRLWGLGPLANIDKHNTLVPVGALANVNVVGGLRITKAKTGIIFSPTMSSLYEGLILSNLGAEGTIEFGGGPNFELSAHVVFGYVAVFEGEEIGPTLHELAQRVGEIMHGFELHCFGQQESQDS